MKERKIGVKVFSRERDASRTDPIRGKSEQDKYSMDVMFKHI